jgi:predicted MPP superfamily phosphohydrolase
MVLADCRMFSMANTYLPPVFSAVALGVLWLIVTVWVYALHRQWWSLRGVRRLLWAFPVAGAGMLALWLLGIEWNLVWLTWLASMTVAVMVSLSIALVLTLPFSGAALTLERFVLWIGRKRRKSREVDQGRRSLIAAAAVLPAATAMTAGLGTLYSYGPVRMPEVPLLFPDLPSDLEGLRILHLSDLHLGYYADLDDLERMMAEAALHRPDLVLVTGDIADDLKILPGALRIIDGLKPKLGAFASLGNHEYYRGIKEVMRIIDAGPIPLLKDAGATLKSGGSTLYLCGVDDPVWALPQGSREVTLRNSVLASLEGAPSGAFYLAMSHRPEGFDFAAPEGIHLTVAGHYHAAQVGFGGRSALETIFPKRYLWGHYRRGASQLYTSAGAGHWFPFRLNCPREVPLYLLKRGTDHGLNG